MPPLPSTITFDGGTISDDLFWGGTTTTPGSVVNRADAVGGTTKALQYPDINDDEETFFEIYVVAAPGDDTLTVRYEVSSEENYDYFRILVDEADVLEPGEPGVSGDGAGWQEFTTTLSHGSRTLRFSYSKDSSADEGDDTTWISSITVPPIAPKPSVGASTLADLTSTASGTTTEYPGQYRFWRLVFLYPNDKDFDVGVQEVEMRGSVGGADLTGTGTATASSSFVSTPPSYAFDNDTTTPGQYWAPSSWTEGCWLSYEFSYPWDVQQIALWPGLYTDNAPRDFRVEYSQTGDAWVTNGVYRGETGWLRNTARTFDLVGANRRNDASVGVLKLLSNVLQSFVLADKVAVSKITLFDPIRATKMVVHSYTQMPYNPTGLPVTHTTFKCRGVVYAADGVGGLPGTLIATTDEITNTQDNDPSRSDNDRRLGNWFDLTFPAPGWLFLTPGSYYIGVQIGGDQDMSTCSTQTAFSSAYMASATYASGAPAAFPGSPTTLTRLLPVHLIYPESIGASTLAAATSTATGVVGEEGITGAASNTLALLTGEASGAVTAPITGTATAALEALTGSATGTRLRPGFGVRVSLMGTLRPTKSLNATWVPR